MLCDFESVDLPQNHRNISKATKEKYTYSHTVEIVYNETGYNEQPDITSKFGAEVWSRI